MLSASANPASRTPPARLGWNIGRRYANWHRFSRPSYRCVGRGASSTNRMHDWFASSAGGRRSSGRSSSLLSYSRRGGRGGPWLSYSRDYPIWCHSSTPHPRLPRSGSRTRKGKWTGCSARRRFDWRSGGCHGHSHFSSPILGPRSYRSQTSGTSLHPWTFHWRALSGPTSPRHLHDPGIMPLSGHRSTHARTRHRRCRSGAAEHSTSRRYRSSHPNTSAFQSKSRNGCLFPSRRSSSSNRARPGARGLVRTYRTTKSRRRR